VAFSTGGGRSTLTEINVTPLVDVMLVLLIIFMVAAPLIQQGVQVNLPETRAKAIDATEQKLVLSIKADRTLWLGAGDEAARVPADRLEELLRANARAQKEKELYLMADKALPYGVVVDVMAAVQRAGITSMGMITNPQPERTRPKGAAEAPTR
jgi:biopolymer transport protein TolR